MMNTLDNIILPPRSKRTLTAALVLDLEATEVRTGLDNVR